MSVTTDHSSTLQQAGQLIRAGRLAEAAALGEAALGGGSDPVLHAMVGTIALKIGQHDRAVAHLDRAHQAKPGDQTIRLNLVEALAALGQAERAWSLLPPATNAADDPALAWRAYLAQETGRFDQAVPLYREIVRRDPNDWSSWNNLGNSLNALGQDAEAAEALRRAVALVPDAAPIRLNLANVLIDLGEGEPARQELLELTRRHPDDAKAWGTLSTLYKRAGHEDDSFDALAKAAELAPDDANILTDFGQAAAFRNRFELAEQCFERALALEPSLSGAYLGLGNLFERTNREKDLPALLDRAERHGASPESLHFLRALKLKRETRFEEALAEVDQSMDAVVLPRRRQVRGQILDRLGRADEAWDEFSEMNRLWEEDPIDPLQRARTYVEQVRGHMDALSPEWIASWQHPAPRPERRTPVFLVGFPRSGTTLLDTMLMGHPDARVLEEEPFVVQVEQELGGFDAFPTLTTERLAEAQASYFAKVATLVDLAGDPLVVDKQPLNLNRVPTIKRLFPDAKFILALRHPLDVLLSCYVTNFRPNMGMANFLRLDDAANLYDLTFTYWEKARALFGLDVHTIVYERMVEDPAGQLKPLVEWMGLHWRDELLDHQKTASSRGHISTASYAQVVEPIYTRSKGRWQRYAKHLEPIIPTVRPWIDKFGYDL
ncbi:tetratricopeptide repeat-containing sulfotransferase family protein [Sphingomonas astaxanthinifaciens]|uniref:Sulfotransferase n=1 Tax=Sphingomonas astaxanthinifaciens DSM 22298 TaxID=1123267 RepID=A0ABQ5Z150_9SPHN|nr:sulfotransferase [Sphingomonas astaxanthinifaciens]GLR46495.1 sulfotransferase [Sphingomonas astaxanthinifaciens DSM 22298]